MANYKTSWVQRLIDGVWQKTFAFAHAKTVYTDYAKKKTLADKLSEIDTEIGNKANKTETTVNLLNPTLLESSVSNNGITCTNNEDGTCTFSGKATDTAIFTILNTATTSAVLNRLSGEKIKLIGCPKSGSYSTYKLQVYTSNHGQFVDLSNGAIFTVPSDAEGANVAVLFYSGYTANNLIFKPMLTTNLSATYDDFVPYTGDTGQLNKDVADIRRTANFSHNIPRIVPKDITSYVTDGSIWKRLNGTDGYSLFEDIYVGDYIKMSRPISAKNPDASQQLTGSQYVTIASIDGLMHNGDNNYINYHHLVMVPGQGFGGTQHFGRAAMNASNTTVGGYKGSVMNNTILGSVVTAGSTASDATVNQQLYAEFGSHLKTTRELASNGINATGYNRFGVNSGCSNNWEWISAQAILMSEIEVYGSIVWSSSGYDTGNEKMQLPLFANSREAMNNRSSLYWLKDVASSSDFCRCNDLGNAYYGNAGLTWGFVRPRFILAA